MALANVSNGTQTATLDTEHTLATVTTGKTCVLLVDTVNLANGDVVILRAKVKTLTGSTEALAYMATFAHVQNDPVKISVPVPALYSVKFTLEQTDGTGRSFDWSVLSLD